MSQASNDKTCFLIHYRDPKNGDLVSLKANSIADSTLGLSFVCISDFIFEKGLVVRPSEEQLQKRLEKVKSLHLSIYSIISIEEVGLDHKGLRFDNDKSNILVMPSSSSGQIFTPPL